MPLVIEVGKITKLQVKQIKSANKLIWYGISTDKTLGIKDPRLHAEIKAYCALSGRVF